MAPITWKNIGIPSLTGILDAQAKAGEKVGEALNPLERMLTDAQKNQQDQFDANTKLTTQNLLASVRNTTDIDQLKKDFNPELLLGQYGAAGYDQAAVDTQIKEQESLLKHDATNKLMTELPSFGSKEDIFKYVSSLDQNKYDIDRIQSFANQGFQAKKDDIQQSRDEEEYNRKQLKIKETEASDAATNQFIQRMQSGRYTPEQAQNEVMRLPGVNQQAVLASTTKALMDYSNVNPMEQQSIDSFIDDSSAKVTQYKLSLNNELNRLRTQLAQTSFIDPATQKEIATMKDEDGLPINPATALKNKLGGLFMIGDPDVVIDQAMTSMEGIPLDAQQKILWVAARNTPGSTNIAGNKKLEKQTFLNEVTKLKQKYESEIAIQEEVTQLENLIGSVSASLDADIRSQANAMKSASLRFGSNTPVNYIYDETRAANIITSAKDRIDSLKGKLNGSDKPDTGGKENNPKTVADVRVMAEELKKSLHTNSNTQLFDPTGFKEIGNGMVGIINTALNLPETASEIVIQQNIELLKAAQKQVAKSFNKLNSDFTAQGGFNQFHRN